MDQYHAMLRYAAGVATPLQFHVTRPDGSVENVTVEAPYAILGRSEDSDVSIPDRRVAFRHVYLQAIGPRIACVSLFGLLGYEWDDGATRSWLTPGHSLNIAGHQIRIQGESWVDDDALMGPTDFRARDEHLDEYGSLPRVDLELLNTSAKGKHWPINRVITLLGRDERCRITVLDERISRVHCSLLLLPSGLWAIDLMGRGGIFVNGHQVPCCQLAEGTELQVGPYKLRARYPQLTQSPDQTGFESDFLTRHNRFLKVESFHDTLIVVPTGNLRQILYQELHLESSRIMDLIQSRRYRNIVIDFAFCESVGAILIEAIASFCRGVSGRASLCGLTDSNRSVLERSNLHRIWPLCGTRQEALQVVYSQ